jgi:uncharacterized RDD family membrane protein YckC
MSFAKGYALASALMIFVPVLIALFNHKLASAIGFTESMVWLIFSLVALAQFQRDRISLSVPLLYLIATGLTFQIFLMGVAASPMLTHIFTQVGLVAGGICLAFFTVAAVRLFLNLKKRGTSTDEPPLATVDDDEKQGGFWRRCAAAVIDGLLIGIVGGVLFIATVMAAAVLAHQDLGALFASQSLAELLGPTCLAGFGFGFLSPIAGANHLLTTFAYLTRLQITEPSDAPGLLVSAAAIVAINLVSWIYFASMESSPYQATAGKLVLGLQVTDQTGKRLTFWRAALRFFYKVLSFVVFCLGYAFISMSPHRQALHDLLAGSLVTKKDSPASQTAPAV